MQSINPLKEVVHLAPLLVALCVLHDLVLGLWGEELAHTGYREHYLLQATVLANNLLIRTCAKVKN